MLGGWLLYAVDAMPGSLDECVCVVCVCVGFRAPARWDCPFRAPGVSVEVDESDVLILGDICICCPRYSITS